MKPPSIPKTSMRLVLALLCTLGSWLSFDLALRPLADKWLPSVEGGLTDLRHKCWWFLHGPGPDDPPSPVTVVDIDERTLGKLGFYGENYRRYHAQVLHRLTEMGAGVVAFDVFFSSSDSGNAQMRELEGVLGRVGMEVPKDSGTLRRLRGEFDYSQSLAREVAASPECILSAKLEDDSKYPNPSDWIPRATREWQHAIDTGIVLSHAKLATLPGHNVLDGIYPGLKTSWTPLGLVNVSSDPDGRYRRLHLLLRFPDTCFTEPRLAPNGTATPRAYASLALQGALRLLGRRPQDIHFQPGKFVDLGRPLRLGRAPSGDLVTSAPGLTTAMVEDLRAAAPAIDSLTRLRKGVLSPTRAVLLERRRDGSFVTRLTYPDTLDDAATQAMLANAGDTSWISQIPTNAPAALSDRVLARRDPDGTLELESYDAPGGRKLSSARLEPRDRDILLLHARQFLPQGAAAMAPGSRIALSNWIEVWWDRVRGRLTTSLLPLRGASLTQLVHLPAERIAALKPGEAIGLGDPVRIPVDAQGAMRLHFQAPELTDGRGMGQSWIRHVSFVDVLNGKLDPALVPGRAFVVGSSATALFDFVPIPLQERYPGVSLQATALQNIVSGDFLTEPPLWIRSLILLGLALTAALLTARLSPLWAISSTVGLLVAWFIGSTWLFSHGVWTEIQLPFLAAMGAHLSMLGMRWLLEEREKRFLNAAFKTYISPELIDIMVESGKQPRLGGEEREITAFFSDIQGFSTFSEAIGSPERLVDLLNEYLGALTDILKDNRGTLDKYIGDAIVALFGAPAPVPDHAHQALLTAVQMQKQLAELRAKWQSEGNRWPPQVHGMRMRIGLNTGNAVTGNMGSDLRMNYTMMGDMVNLAARLESASKQYGVFVMASQETLTAAGSGFLSREIDLLRVVGKSEPTRVHEILGVEEDATTNFARLMETWNLARSRYLNGDFAGARERFLECLRWEPWYGQSGVKTCPSLVFAARCEHFLKEPPQAWDGIWTATQK